MPATSRFPDGRKRLNVYLELDAYEQLQALADLNNRSMTGQAAVCIERDLKRQKAKITKATPD